MTVTASVCYSDSFDHYDWDSHCNFYSGINGNFLAAIMIFADDSEWQSDAVDLVSVKVRFDVMWWSLSVFQVDLSVQLQKLKSQLSQEAENINNHNNNH